MRNAGLDEAQAGIKMVRKNINNLRYADDTTLMGFHGGSMVKLLPTMRETQVQSLGQEDPLEKEMATHSSFLA